MSMIEFDPRSKLCMILFASFLLVFPSTSVIEIFFVSLLFFLFIMEGKIKKGFIFYGIYWLLFACVGFSIEHANSPIGSIFSFLIVGNRKMLPTIMAGAFVTDHTKVSEWSAALKKCHLPNSIIIPLMVLFRFFPTLIQDAKSIRNAMRYRGISISPIHPFKTMEFMVIPIVMSAENTANDLTAAALVRGISNPEFHSSIYDVRFRIQDYVLLFILLCGVLGRFFL